MMAPFHGEFPGIAEKNKKHLHIKDHHTIPNGMYLLTESYCNERNCDCRNVMINVYKESDYNNILATINYGWEDIEFYRKFTGRGKSNKDYKELKGPFLDPLNRQSEFAPHLLEEFKKILTEEYIEILKKHYKMFKDKTNKTTPAGNKIKMQEVPGVGRNEPCPCGSGKKYKKCCGSKQKSMLNLEYPEDLRTGTLLDEYMRLFGIVSTYALSILSDDEKNEYEKIFNELTAEFKPGTQEGISDSFFFSFIMLDFVFGKNNRTVFDKFIDSEHFSEIDKVGQELLRDLSCSYFSFYKVSKVTPETIVLDELGTGNKWHMVRVDEPYEKENIQNEIWFMRLIGWPDECYAFTTPYNFPPKSISVFKRATKEQMNALKHLRHLDERLCISSKQTALFWMRHLMKGISVSLQPRKPPPMQGNTPIMQNMDGEPLAPSTTRFRIKEMSGLSEELTSLNNIDYHSKDEEWIWFKKSNRKISPMMPTITLGTMQIKDNMLIAETNSLKRALKLKNKLMRSLNKYIEYERIDATDIKAMPRPTEEEMRKFAEKHEKFNSLPELKKLLNKKSVDYYNDSWLYQKIPALNYKTPFNAVKTPEGRERVKELIDGLARLPEKISNLKKSDLDNLRKRLGLIK